MSSLSIPTAVDTAASDAGRRVPKSAPTYGPTYALVSGGHDSNIEADADGIRLLVEP